jgi:SAM-dependent methyltransferase
MPTQTPSRTGVLDWSPGRYEQTAAQLLPAAERVVARADPQPGERLLDVGCGTGNAALLAAARGARVAGVDPAPRLVAVARERARASSLDAAFVEGVASALPQRDASVDVAVSVFGVIFADDAPAVAAELARVAAPTARIVLTAWVPGAAMAAAGGVQQQAVLRALGVPPVTPFAWHAPAALADLLGPYGFAVTTTQAELAFTAASATDYVDGEFASHPLSVHAARILGDDEAVAEVRSRALAILEKANEDPEAFRVTSRYVVATAERRG